MSTRDAETVDHPNRLGSARRFVSTYRWELFLLFALPTFRGLLNIGVGAASLRLANRFDWECAGYSCLRWPYLALSVLLLAVLVATYPFVRKQGRELLTLLWQLKIALGCVGVVLSGVSTILGNSLPSLILFDVFRAEGFDGGWGSVSLSAYGLPDLALYAWFMRRASRIGLSHALLLFGLSFADESFGGGYTVVRTVIAFPTLPYLGTTVSHFLAELGVSVLMFRVLVRSDAFSPAARMRAAAVLMAAAALENLLGWFMSMNLTFGVLLGFHPTNLAFVPVLITTRALDYAFEQVAVPLTLGYLVRVRRRVEGEGGGMTGGSPAGEDPFPTTNPWLDKLTSSGYLTPDRSAHGSAGTGGDDEGRRE